MYENEWLQDGLRKMLGGVMRFVLKSERSQKGSFRKPTNDELTLVAQAREAIRAMVKGRKPHP